MLQRAASNAYTWWWASHIRKKQSKWLDQNLQEMEEKVKAMLTIIEEDGDSFAKRAEMYYRKRPELIHFVEESYKAYRALAQRYDHISGELQNANNTIATVFPDKVQFAMEEDEEDGSVKASPPIPGLQCDKFSKNPTLKGFDKDLSSLPSKSSEMRRNGSVMNKATVQEEIDKLQKGILVLQTEKEFIKSSYETRLTKYWQIEKQITEMQEYISNLQDELGGGVEIEDDEARALMAATAIKTCEDTLFQLRELQKKSREDVIVEAQRIKGVQERLNVIKNKTSLDKKEFKESSSAQDIELIVIKDLTEAVSCLKQERRELQSISEMVKKHFEFNSDNADSVAELAEKIDELVNKVINLETSVSLQTAQIKQLKSGNDKIQQELNVLEEDDDLINRKGKIKEVEDELQGIKDLNQSIVSQDQELQARFYVACDAFDNISEKLQNKKSDEESPLDEKLLTLESHEFKEEQKIDKETEQQEEIHEINDLNSRVLDEKEIPKHSESRNNVEEHYENLEYPKIEEEDEMQKQCAEQEDCLNWKQMFLNGMEDREKILLAEYTSVLRNYKEAKKKMIDLEKKNQDTLFENLGQIRQLKSANAMKDDEIRTLRQKLKLLELSPDASTDLNLIEEDEINGKYRPADLSNDISDQKKLEHPLNDEEIVPVLRDETPSGSKLEEKFRRDIDELLGENLEFWLRFSSSFEQIQKFQADVQDLQAEFSKLKTENIDNKDHNRSSTSSDQSVKSECTSISNNLKEIQKELKVWLEQNALLKEELQGRLSSLAEIQEELSRVCKIDSTNNEGDEFTTYQASKFQGEISNMQQENKKVADELQVGLDHVKGLQVEVEKVLSKLQEDFDLPGSKTHGHHYQHLKNSINRTRIPLRSFLFGVKQKKPSIFSCMSPALQKQYSDLRRGNANVN